MNLRQIEKEALRLSEEDRAQLAQRLILSLEVSGEEIHEQGWLLEAKCRAHEIDSYAVQPITAEEVREKAQCILN